MTMRLVKMALVAISLAACSAKVTSSGGGPVALPTGGGDGGGPTKPAVPGPNVEGMWQSSCNKKPDTDMYRELTLTFKAGTIERTEQTFTDAGCGTSIEKKTSFGQFAWAAKNDTGTYSINYVFKVGTGYEISQGELIFSDNHIVVSDFVGAGGLLEDEPLWKDGKAPRDPGAQIVSSYTDAKYAFCSTQGYGVLIDFRGYNFMMTGSGDARIGTKVCGKGNQLKWGSALAHFSVSVEKGLPQIHFPDSEYSDYITPASFQNGLQGSQAANAAMFGNSGECFFLKTTSTSGIPFAFECE